MSAHAIRVTIAAGFAAMSAGLTPGVAADTFLIDAAHTHVMFKVERFGLSNTIGSFVDVEGAVTLDHEAPENSSVEATIAVASIDSDNEEREGHLRGEHWFNATVFPTMRFQSSSVEVTSESTARVAGDLTLHGVTRPVTLDVRLRALGPDPVSKREAAGFTAKTKLNRHDFGISTADGMIGDEVDILIEAFAIKAE